MKTTLCFLFICMFTLPVIAQDEAPRDSVLQNEIDSAIEEALRSLEDLEIPEVDVEQILEDVRAAMPSKDELESIKDEVADALREVKNIDLSSLEEAMEELRRELDEVFGRRPREE